MEAYPLQWPVGYKRTANRIHSRFEQSMETAQRFLRIEVSRINGKDLIVSTNIPVRKDGMLYTDWMKKKIEDPGVAIYFKYKGKDISMCCDQYLGVWENIYALGKGIEALRSMERWGVSDFLERAFTGFAAIPEVSSYNMPSIWVILGLPGKPAGIDEVHAAYKRKAKEVHPDTPNGNEVEFIQLQTAYKQAKSMFE